jgi:hypothetical protein
VLETGTRLTPAINLYEAMRYARIPLFGELNRTGFIGGLIPREDGPHGTPQ